MHLKLFAVLLIIAVAQAHGQALYEAKKDTAKVPRQPYLRYFTKDKFDRQITFYLSETRAASKLPLVVYIHGSGARSHFIKQNEQIIPMNGHIYIAESLNDKARLLIVEKPGVTFLSNPGMGDAVKNDEFNKQLSLDRWSEAIEASIKATIRSGLADSNRILVIGHSEGGLVACKIAAGLTQLVTHIANLAGGGDSQLYDLLVLARKGYFFTNISADSATRAQYVIDQWKKIQEEPLHTEKFFLGFSYLRWSSFLQTSCLEQLEKCNARIFIAQGLKDENLDPASADQLYAHLLSKGKDVVYDRLENADHTFNDKTKPGFNGWKAEMEKIVNWFLQ